MIKTLLAALSAAIVLIGSNGFTPQTPPVQPDYLAELAEHPEYLDGTDFLCPAGPEKLTPAPAGAR